MLKSLSRLALVLSLGIPALALAAPGAVGQGQGGVMRKAKLLERFDTNKDGQLDESERAAMKKAFEAKRAERHQEMLAKYDLDKDGKLSESERAAARQDRLVERFKAIDTNGDGSISLQEFEAAPHPMMKGKFGHHRGGHRGGGWGGQGMGPRGGR